MHHLPSRYIPCDGRLTATAYFNPRSPHGERLLFSATAPIPSEFQSTLPAWGATINKAKEVAPVIIFQSTLPAWGATVQSKHTAMTA